MMEEENNNKSGSIKKILMGMIIGGAVGSVVGAAMNSKELREKIRERLANTSHALKEILHHTDTEEENEEIEEKEQKEETKPSFWHWLNRLFVKR